VGAKLPNKVPSLFSAVTVLPPLFVTQTWPELSTFTSNGLLKFEPDGAKLPSRAPALLRAVSDTRERNRGCTGPTGEDYGLLRTRSADNDFPEVELFG
jgi:hypothetical protein